MLPAALKSMDAAEGRRIATRAMLPSLEGFTGEGKDTNAWKAVEVIQNLGYCMTSSHVEENGRYPKNVPASYDFKEVSGIKSWTLERNHFHIFCVILPQKLVISLKFRSIRVA